MKENTKQTQYVTWLRAKGIMDGSCSLLQAAAKVETYASELEMMHLAGLTLEATIDNGNGCVRTTDDEVAKEFDMQVDELDFENE